MKRLTVYDWVGAVAAFVLTVVNATAFVTTSRIDFLIKGTVSFAWLGLTLIRPRALNADTSPKAIIAASLHTLSISMFQMEGDALYPLLGWILVSAGILLLAVAWGSIGTSFAILPAIRNLKVRGAYTLVRHPIYLSYLCISVGTVLLVFSLNNMLWLLSVAFLTVVRIELEEKLLTAAPGYESYRRNVRFKLLPGLY